MDYMPERNYRNSIPHLYQNHFTWKRKFEKVIQNIFNPYFTTKEGNSGIGLYMSRMIVEKDMKGELLVSNGEEGALFKICF